MTTLAGVYAIVNTRDGKLYIGSSSCIDRRWCKHKHLLRKNKHFNPHLQRAWNRDGEFSFKHIVLSVVGDRDLLLKEEQIFLDTYGLPNDEFGYNIRCKAANNTGFRHSDKTKQKLSKLSRKCWNDPVVREKFMANIQANAKRHYKPVICLETGEKYESITEASLKNNLTPNNVCGSARLFCRVFGKSFRYLDTTGKPVERTIPKNPHSDPKPIRCIENGAVYPSCEEAARALGIAGGGCSVSRQARGRQGTVKGLHFEFINANSQDHILQPLTNRCQD